MKTILFYTSIFSAIVLSSCSKSYEFWDISKFKITETALENDEVVKVIYESGGPEGNTDMDFYYHHIVISLKTGDTVNVLSSVNNEFFKEGDKEKIYSFMTHNDEILKAIKNYKIQSEKGLVSEEMNLESFKDVKLNPITKVVRNPSDDHISMNPYPTIVGIIGYKIKP